MATLVTKYVDTASTAGGDGSTTGLVGATRAFASLGEFRSWLNTNHPSLVASDVQVDCWVAASTGVQDTAPLDASGVNFNQVTDATRYIRILAAAGQEATMPLSTGRYRLVQANGFYNAMTITTVRMDVVSVQVLNTGSRANENRGIVINRQAGGDIRILNCIGKQTGGGTPGNDNTFIRTLGLANGIVTVVNCVSIDFGRGFYAANAGNGGERNYLYNLTVVGSTVAGITFTREASNIHRLKNCLVVAASGSCYSVGGSGGTYDHATCSSSDATSPTVALQSLTPAFENTATGDYHLAAGSAAIGIGTDLSADGSWPFATDLDGEARSAPWDIGADEHVASGGGGGGGDGHYYMHRRRSR